MDQEFAQAAEFHGHYCPGLAIGYRVAKYVKDHFDRSEDEELVAIVENNSCSVDAIQFMLSCTFGKGNLIFKDYGKHVYTFYSRDKERALRIYFKNISPQVEPETMKKYLAGQLSPEEREKVEKMREKTMQRILSASDEELMEVKEVQIPTPKKARIYPSIECQECGEAFMEIKGRTANGKVVCGDCFGKLVT
jgi:formylmethanofuran dehydrogenase subunit E